MAELSRSRSGSRHADNFKFNPKALQKSQECESLSPKQASKGSGTARGSLRSARLGFVARNLKQSMLSLEEAKDISKR